MLKKSYYSLLVLPFVGLAQLTVDLAGNLTLASGDTAPWKDMLLNLVQSLWTIFKAEGVWIVGGIVMLVVLGLILGKLGLK